MVPAPDPHSPSPFSEGELYALETGAYEALCAYTLSLHDPEFIHQYVVDSWAVQHATAHTKPITLTFAMFGLYCGIEKSISGRQVQRFHMQMARTRRAWPSLPLPRGTPGMTAFDVMGAQPGAERNAMILTWAAANWSCCSDARAQVVELARVECGIKP